MVKRTSNRKSFQGIKNVTIKGFKSISNEISIDINYLTIFSGSNSSGKSSFFQPLLLMKQTMEENIDPGVFSLDGGHVGFNKIEQIFSKITNKRRSSEFSIKISLSDDISCYLVYENTKDKGIRIKKAIYQFENRKINLESDMSSEQFFEKNPYLKKQYKGLFEAVRSQVKVINQKSNFKVIISPNRCFLDASIEFGQDFKLNVLSSFINITQISNEIQRIIHIPPVRALYETLYKYSPIEGKLPGTFEYYVPSIINHWKSDNDPKFQQLRDDLHELGLAWSISTHEIDDTTVELRFPLSPKQIPNRKRIDWIRITDLGFGVSQVLPILVALTMAKPEQIVYIEQPEIHLHPQAQLNLAKIMVKAANRGVRIVIETHSDLLILGIQTLVAEGEISKDKTKLHWFTRESDGSTNVVSSQINEDGSFNNWPLDFGKIDLIAQARFLNASESAKKIKN
jgi:predicted ATP-dependent endonuclease of OLD family